MDISLEIEEYKLNIRAAVVIIHDNRVLVHRNMNKDHYALPGGRVLIGEDSEETVKREMKEEIGKQIEITGYVTTIENFFKMDGKKYHEIVFIYRAEFIDNEDRKLNHILYNIEGKEYLQYEWLDLNKIEEYNVLPKCTKRMLKHKEVPVHKIDNELKE